MAKRSPEREQWLADVLTTAVEGGVNYWASVSEYKWQDRAPADVYAVIHDQEDDEPGAGHRVTIDTIAHGLSTLRRARATEAWLQSESWRRVLDSDRTNGDEGDFDAGDADCIVQAGIFGEVIYG